MKILTILFTQWIMIITLCSCTGGTPTGETYDLKGFETYDIGGGAQIAFYLDQNGNRLASGQVINGVKTGAWLTYHPNTNQIASITNYINGVKNGIEIKINDRGTIESASEYKNDILHGISGKYHFGKPNEELTYKDGILDGHFAVYTNQHVLQKKGSFKNGKQHGLLQFFNEKGELTMEYQYKDGEKISGGIIEKATPTDQQQ